MIVKLPSSIGVDKLQAWAQSINCDVQLMRDNTLQIVDRNAVPYEPKIEEQPKPSKKKCSVLRLFTGAK